MSQYRVAFTEEVTMTREVEAVVECDDGDPLRQVMNKNFKRYLPKKQYIESLDVALEGISYSEIN